MEIQKPEINPEELLTPEELKDKYSQEVAEYFELEKEEDIKLVVFETMQDIARDFEEYTGIKAPSYLKGFSPNGEKWKEIWHVKWGVPDEHGRIMTRKEFNASIKHELVHTYQKIYCKENKVDMRKLPVWLWEGQSLYLAGQPVTDPGDITLERLRNLDGLDRAKFGIGLKMVSAIMNEYGKNRLLELVKIDDIQTFYDELQKMFEWLK